MKQQMGIALRLLIILSVLTGLLYPLLVAGMAQALMPFQAGGCAAASE